MSVEKAKSSSSRQTARRNRSGAHDKERQAGVETIKVALSCTITCFTRIQLQLIHSHLLNKSCQTLGRIYLGA